MTVSSEIDSAAYAGNGVTTVFAVPFYFLADGDLRVSTVNTATNVETLLTLNSDYTVSGEGNLSGGLVAFFIAPATGINVLIMRAVPATQEIDYVSNDPFPAESHERGLDKLTMLVQQAQSGLNKAIRVQDFDPVPDRLPPAALRANKLFGFDPVGNPIAVGAVSGGIVGANQVLWTRAALAAAITTVQQALDGQSVNLWEYAWAIVSKPVPTDPGTWDWQPAFVAALAAAPIVEIPLGHYKHSGTLPLTNKYLKGVGNSRNFAVATDGVLLECTAPSTATASMTISGFCGIEGLTAIRTGAGKRGKIVSIIGTVERLSFIRDVRLSGCLNGIHGSGFNFYSSLVDNVEIGDYTDRAIFLDCPGATGSVFGNIYTVNWLNFPTVKNTAVCCVQLQGNFTEATFIQLNCEHSIISNACVLLNGVEVALFQTVHCEGIELNANARFFRIIGTNTSGAKVRIQNVQADFNKCLGNGTVFVELESAASGNVTITVDNFRSRNNDINGTSGHRFALRGGTANTNTPTLTATGIDSDLWSGNSFLPIEATTFVPILQRFNEQVFYTRIGGVHYMPGQSTWPLVSGVYPANAIVMNSAVAATGDRGWHIYGPGDFSKPLHGTASYAASSSTVTPDATAYAAYVIGDYIEMLGIVYRITNKFGGSTFLVTPNTPGTPQAGTPVNTAAPQYRAIT